MVFASSLLGALTGWFIVISLGTVTGLIIVIAWRRWGDRVTMPPEMKRVAERMLGPQGAHTTPGEHRTTATTNTTTTETTTEEGAPSDILPEAPSEASSSPSSPSAPSSPSTVQVTTASQESAQEEPSAGDDEPPAHPETGPGPSDDEATPGPGEPEGPEREEAPPRTLSRADAIEEISVLFDAPYEAATALLESGLWGMDNHEEYARAMRGKEPPKGVPPALFSAVVNADPRDYQQVLETLRSKRHSMKELSALWGVGPEQAEALYQAGFRDLESIRKTSTEKLAKTPGIGHALAFQIRAAAHGLAPAP